VAQKGWVWRKTHRIIQTTRSGKNYRRIRGRGKIRAFQDIVGLQTDTRRRRRGEGGRFGESWAMV